LQEEFMDGGRFVSLGASVALPGVAVLLPVVTVALGIAVRRRCEIPSRWAIAARLLIIVSSALFCINLYSAYAIYRAFAAI
jgi:hypothetical protein